MRGFTLIELIIVMAIGIILLSVGFLSLRSFRTEQNLTNDVEAIVALLRSAQEKSINREGDARWGLYLDNQAEDDEYYTLYEVDELLVGSQDMPAASVNTRRNLSRGLDFAEPADAGTKNIMFSKSTGFPNVSTTITLLIEQTGAQHTITVGSNGRINY